MTDKPIMFLDEVWMVPATVMEAARLLAEDRKLKDETEGDT